MEIKILNDFGIKPTNTFTSAGADFYVPNIDPKRTENITNIVNNAFMTSYNIKSKDLDLIYESFKRYLNVKKHNEEDNITIQEIYDRHILNLIHLFLALDAYKVNTINSLELKVKYFIEHYLIFDKKYVPGIQMQNGDKVLINSGIKVGLPSNSAGVFFNKSGKGNAGWDVRAQVVDEDYTGYVHLSLEYCVKNTEEMKTRAQLFCGDKLTQMLVLPIIRMEPVEINDMEYYNYMSNSQRGSKAFGHSDVIH